MSSIYIQEPATSGRIVFSTTFGDIEIELWAKETPKACRNFIQLCMEGYYNNTIIHRIEKGFIIQCGDPTGTGRGGESIYGQPFKDEIHSRLRFTRRGLVAMATSEQNGNGSQFFFTLAPTPELNGKHTIFGRVSGDTIYNLLKLESVEVDEENRPVYKQKILSAEVLKNFFTDIVPRCLPDVQIKTNKKDKKAEKSRNIIAVKNFSLLSFGDEAAEDEKETEMIAKQFSGKSKSSHDMLNDPTLSSQPAVVFDSDHEYDKSDKKCVKSDSDEDLVAEMGPSAKVKNVDKDEDCSDSSQGKKEELRRMQKECARLKKELRKLDENPENTNTEKFEESNDYAYSKKKLTELKASKTRKQDGEDLTLALLEKFKKKILVGEKSIKKEVEKSGGNQSDERERWVKHELKFETAINEMAKDANSKTDDWYDIYDPKNAMNKRKREKSSKQEIRFQERNAKRFHRSIKDDGSSNLGRSEKYASSHKSQKDRSEKEPWPEHDREKNVVERDRSDSKQYVSHTSSKRGEKEDYHSKISHASKDRHIGDHKRRSWSNDFHYLDKGGKGKEYRRKLVENDEEKSRHSRKRRGSSSSPEKGYTASRKEGRKTQYSDNRSSRKEYKEKRHSKDRK